MSIVKISRKQNPFVMIDKSIFEDNTISWAAKGVMGYLLSKPDGWSVNVADIINHSPVNENGQKKRGNGEEAVYKLLKELRLHGYAHHEFKRDSKGVIIGSEWIVFESKQPYPEKPDTGKPDAAKPDGVHPHISNNDLSNNEFSNNSILTDTITEPPKSEKPNFAKLPLNDQLRAVYVYAKGKLSSVDALTVSQDEKKEKRGKYTAVAIALNSDEFRAVLSEYKEYRKTNKGIKPAKKWYDSEITLCGMVAELAILAGVNGGNVNMPNVRRIFDYTVEKSYTGFYLPPSLKVSNPATHAKNDIPAASSNKTPYQFGAEI